MLLGYIPVCKFAKTEFPSSTQQDKIPGPLQAHLYHMAMSLILKLLKNVIGRKVLMADSKGNVHDNCLFLALLIADKQEQNEVVCLGANSCPHCLAETKYLVSKHPCQAHIGESILKRTKEVQAKVGPDASNWTFISECTKRHLSGVEHPFWEGMEATDICKIICNDVLHSLHKHSEIILYNGISR